VLAVVAVAQFMVILDASIVNVALPTVKRELGFTERDLSWILDAYTLMFGGFLLLGGRLADRLGRRRVFMAGIAVFSIASFVCGLSQSHTALLVARGLQGLGAAMVSPAALSIILTTFPEGHERNRACAVWGAVAGAGGAVGLLLGGVIVDTLGWRWVFFVNVPIGVAVLALAPRIVPESRVHAPARGGYDLGGALAITLGTLALVFTLLHAYSWGWSSDRTIGGLIVSGLLLAAFVAIERRHEEPLVPMRIFKNRSLSVADGTLLIMSAALFVIFFFLTLYLQEVLGFSPSETGLAYMPLSLTIIGASGLASRLVDRFAPKPVLVAGLLLTTGGFVLLATLSGHGDYGSRVAPAMVILGIGPGLAFVAVTIAGTRGVARGDSGVASGLLNTTQQVGGALGLAILSTIAANHTAAALHSGRPMLAALTDGYKVAFAVAAVLCFVGAIIATVLLPGRRHARAEDHVEAVALSFSRFPGAPHAGHLAHLLAFGRRVRSRLVGSEVLDQG
jgi:EmrB/QacA subfamily drug resistance transporter